MFSIVEDLERVGVTVDIAMRSKRSRRRSNSPHTSVRTSNKRQRFNGEADTQQYTPEPCRVRRTDPSADVIVSDLLREIVTVHVGPKAFPFPMYKGLLCQDSSFFKHAFEGGFREAHEQSISLPEDDVEVFKVYQTWLIFGKICFTFDDEEWWLRLAKGYVFGDKIDSEFANRILSTFFTFMRGNRRDIVCPSPEATTYVYDHTAPGSLLRQCFTTCFALVNKINVDLNLYPKEFLAALVGTSLKFYDRLTTALVDLNIPEAKQILTATFLDPDIPRPERIQSSVIERDQNEEGRRLDPLDPTPLLTHGF